MKKLVSVIVLLAILGVFGYSTYTYISNYSAYKTAVETSVEKANAMKITIARDNYVSRGRILDRYGKVLQESEIVADKHGRKSYRIKTHDEKANAHALGYESSFYGNYGPLSKVGAFLYEDPEHDGTGSDLVLSIDGASNAEIYQKLEDIAATQEASELSVFVMAPNGEVLVNAAYPSFSCDLINNAEKKIPYLSDMQGDTLLNTNLVPTEPGSTIKVFNYVAIDDSGLKDFTYQDIGKEETGEFVLKNDSGAVYGNISLDFALKKSVNTYFAHMCTKELGRETMAAYASAVFGNGYLETDFGDLKCAYNYLVSDNASETDWEFALGQNSIGQGGVALSPAMSAVVLNGLLTGTKMLPRETKDSKTIDLWNGTAPFKTEVSADLKQAMLETAKGYGIRDSIGGYKILAKTGTASKGDKTTNAWILSGLLDKNNNLKYVCCIVKKGTKQYGKSNKDLLIDVYKTLISNERM